MPKLLSCAETEEAVLDRTKTETRRLGWWEDKNGRRLLLPGDRLTLRPELSLAKSIRNVDSPGRYGGEAMMVVLPGATTACAREVAERIRKEVCGAPVHTIWGSIPVTMSLGVAGTDTVGCRMVMLLVQAADQALYQAKEAGRDQVVCLSA